MRWSIRKSGITHWCLAHAADVLTIALLLMIIWMLWGLKP